MSTFGYLDTGFAKAANTGVPRNWAKGLTKETHPGIAANAASRLGSRYQRRTPLHLQKKTRRWSREGPLVWSGRLAYAVGLAATDGCLYKGGRHVAFTSGDRELLETFLACVGHPVKYRTVRGIGGSAALQAQFSDVELYEILTSAGLTPRKSRTIGALSVPDHLLFHLVRGLLDGDGGIQNFVHAPTRTRYPNYLYERLWTFFNCASRPHLEWLCREIKNRLGIEGYLETFKPREGRGAMYRLKYGKHGSISLLAKLYDDPNAPRLGRKWQTWESYRVRNLVPKEGLEPSRPCDHTALNRTPLPVGLLRRKPNYTTSLTPQSESARTSLPRSRNDAPGQ